MKVRVAELLTSCGKPAHFPSGERPEVAFLGRSNVGKSSLLNALVNRRGLARTSATPGKTRLIHFFRVEAEGLPELLLADLPGYGWARVSKKERQSWQRLIESYLGDRPPLRVAVLLQDVRRDFSEDETLLLDWLTERGVPSLIVITKTDKLKPMRRKERLRVLRSQLADRDVTLIATSSQARQGLRELWGELSRRIGSARE